MPTIAQSLDYRVDVGIVFIGLGRDYGHSYSIIIFCVRMLSSVIKRTT